MNRILFLMLALLLCFPTLGCDSTQAMQPVLSEPTAIVPSGATLAWVEVDGVRTMAWVQKSGPSGAYRILYICDGPMIGPIQPGHCRADGSDCQGPEIGPTGTYAAPKRPGDADVANNGDPTADDMKQADPDITNDAADADGIVVR